MNKAFKTDPMRRGVGTRRIIDRIVLLDSECHITMDAREVAYTFDKALRDELISKITKGDLVFS